MEQAVTIKRKSKVMSLDDAAALIKNGVSKRLF